MGMATLFEQGWEAFARENFDSPGALWIFLHIPKTAGSSFRTEMAHTLRPNANITIDHSDSARSFRERREEAIGHFLASHAERHYRFASGHITYSQATRILSAEPNTRIITMLRDPTKRLISAFRYMRTPVHPLNESFKKQFATIEEYVEHPSSQNAIYEYLALNPNEPVADVVKRMDEVFTFVGLLEAYPLSFKAIFRLLGKTRAPTVHTRKTEDRGDNRVNDSDKLEARIRELNAKDWAIYDHYRKRFRATRDSLREALSGARLGA